MIQETKDRLRFSTRILVNVDYSNKGYVEFKPAFTILNKYGINKFKWKDIEGKPKVLDDWDRSLYIIVMDDRISNKYIIWDIDTSEQLSNWFYLFPFYFNNFKHYEEMINDGYNKI